MLQVRVVDTGWFARIQDSGPAIRDEDLDGGDELRPGTLRHVGSVRRYPRGADLMPVAVVGRLGAWISAPEKRIIVRQVQKRGLPRLQGCLRCFDEGAQRIPKLQLHAAWAGREVGAVGRNRDNVRKVRARPTVRSAAVGRLEDAAG